MKTVIVLLALFGLALAFPAKSPSQQPRRFLPEENDPYRIKYLMYVDEAGTFHFEDLTRDIPTPRVTINDVTMYLYTRKNPDTPEIFKTEDLSGLTNSKVYDPKKMNYFITHGLNNNFESPLNKVVKNAILFKEDCNVFVVDWSRLANKNYLTAKGAVTEIGFYLGDFVNRILDKYDITTDQIRLIGHSLGAHVSGCAGDEIIGLPDFIIGLDPAGPLFTVANIKNRLDPSDGDYVQIIHTAASTLGFGSSIGDSDFYPNNGKGQPGCGIDLLGICAHSRSYYYLAESIHTGGFGAVECESYKAFQKGQCANNKNTYFGSLKLDRSAHGDFYLDTGKEYPFSLIP